MKKVVVVINGRGGVGKDTLCDMAAKYFKTMNISSITPIKNIASLCGWDGTKDDKSRKFLSDLKKILSEYNEYPTNYLLEEYENFLQSDREILFVHIRESIEIDKFRKALTTPSIALLITRSTQDTIAWGNSSDDDVDNYKYDFVFDNNMSLPEIEPIFCVFLREIIDNIC